MSNRVLSLAVILILFVGGFADDTSVGASIDQPFDEVIVGIDAITTTGKIVSFDEEADQLVVETSDRLLTLDDLTGFEALFDEFKIGEKVSLTYEWVDGDEVLIDIEVIHE